MTQLVALTALESLTITDSPFAMVSEDSSSAASSQSTDALDCPLAYTLSALTHLTRLRLGHSGRLNNAVDVVQTSGKCSEYTGDSARVHAVYAAVSGLGLRELTLDCHPCFSGKDLQRVVSGALYFAPAFVTLVQCGTCHFTHSVRCIEGCMCG